MSRTWAVMRSAMSVTAGLPPLLPGAGTALGAAAGSRLRPTAAAAGAGAGGAGGGGGAGRGGRDGYAVVVGVVVLAVRSRSRCRFAVELRRSDLRGGAGLGDRGRCGGAARVGRSAGARPAALN